MRINVESEWFSDPRRTRLADIVGNFYLADGLAINAWVLAFHFWKKRELIPHHAWSGSGLPESLFECGLAENRPEGIYVRGCSSHFEWYHKKCDALKKNASKAGKKSAQMRREKYGTAQPNAKNPEPNPNGSRTDGERTPNASNASSSSSSSSSSSKKNNIYRSSDDDPFEINLEKVYDAYPLKKGKSKGMDKLRKQIKTKSDLQKLEKAVENYKRSVEKDRRLGFKELNYKHFSTFVGEWMDWVTWEEKPSRRVAHNEPDPNFNNLNDPDFW